MALTFGGATSTRVDIAANATIDTLAAATYLMWIYPTTLTAGRVLMAKVSGGAGLIHPGATSNIRMRVARATTNLTAEASQANLGVATNKWCFLGTTYDVSGVAADQKLFGGSLTSPAAEPASYSSQTAGSGAQTSDAANALAISNNPVTTNVSFIGDIAWVGVWNRVLTSGEILAQQFNPHVTSGCVVFMPLGWNGTSTQPDWSGNGNNGTVTGATVAAHVPLRPLYGGFAGWRGNYTASGPTTRLSRLLLLGVG